VASKLSTSDPANPTPRLSNLIYYPEAYRKAVDSVKKLIIIVGAHLQEYERDVTLEGKDLTGREIQLSM
jgi:hypothetical protein